jgi:hypothetical protein
MATSKARFIPKGRWSHSAGVDRERPITSDKREGCGGGDGDGSPNVDAEGRSASEIVVSGAGVVEWPSRITCIVVVLEGRLMGVLLEPEHVGDMM